MCKESWNKMYMKLSLKLKMKSSYKLLQRLVKMRISQMDL